MVLSSHIIVASAIAAPLALKPFTFGNSAAFFLISFLSHYIFDLIPHWEYQLLSIRKIKNSQNGNNKELVLNRNFITRDLLKISIDSLLGIIIVFLFIFPPINLENILIVAIIAFASIAPDALQIVYLIFKKPPFTYLQKLHYLFHARPVFINQPFKGIFWQVVVVAIIVIFLKL